VSDELAHLLGRHVLAGITLLGDNDELIDQFQVHGIVSAADDAGVVLDRGDEPAYGLPPGPELFEPAESGEYTLRSTGEVVDDPDYLVSLSVHVSDQGNAEELRNVGYRPPLS
jgi:hypothetical protein